MSPIPSPAPLRRTVARILFSPAALLFGFVVLLITTCPGARGESSFGPLMGTEAFRAPAVAELPNINVPVVPVARPSAVIGRSTRFDRVPSSSARSATLTERNAAAPAAADSEAFRHSRLAMPLLVADPARAPAANINPMTGPAVGIRPKLPAAKR